MQVSFQSSGEDRWETPHWNTGCVIAQRQAWFHPGKESSLAGSDVFEGKVLQRLSAAESIPPWWSPQVPAPWYLPKTYLEKGKCVHASATSMQTPAHLTPQLNPFTGLKDHIALFTRGAEACFLPCLHGYLHSAV